MRPHPGLPAGPRPRVLSQAARLTRPAPRRRSRAERGAIAQPAWAGWLFGLLLVPLGGATAAWGVYESAAWIGALRRGDGVVTTVGVTLGVPLLGGSLCAIGLFGFLPRSVAMRAEERLTRLVRVLLVCMVAGVVLMPVGTLVTLAVMEYEGFRACDSTGHGRFTTTVWAAPAVPCPPPFLRHADAAYAARA